MRKALFVAIAIVIAFPAMADPWPLHPAQQSGYGYGEHHREHRDMERERAMERAERERHEQWCRYHPGVCR